MSLSTGTMDATTDHLMQTSREPRTAASRMFTSRTYVSKQLLAAYLLYILTSFCCAVASTGLLAIVKQTTHQAYRLHEYHDFLVLQSTHVALETNMVFSWLFVPSMGTLFVYGAGRQIARIQVPVQADMDPYRDRDEGMQWTPETLYRLQLSQVGQKLSLLQWMELYHGITCLWVCAIWFTSWLRRTYSSQKRTIVV